MIHTLRALLPILALLPALAPTAPASTRYVNGALGSGANDGTSSANAFRGADAVAAALIPATAGDEVWVAAGTYVPTTTATRTISHQLENGVALLGGFAGTESLSSQRNPAVNVTILSGDIGAAGTADNSHHVVNASGTNATAILDGFTITLGNANVGGSNNDRGGGILCLSGANPTVRSCRFVSNACSFGGGAGYVGGSSPTFTNCSFESNVGGSFGGAFDCNTTTVTWDRCTFVGNSAARAGAIELFGLGAPRVLNCLFRGNTATGANGGGALWIGSSSTGQVRNSTIVGNFATTATAAGIQVSSATPSIANCIVWDNAGSGGAQASANQISGTSAVTYSIVEGGFAGTGNLATDPQFTNAGANDYRPTLASPAIDAGNNTALPGGFLADLANRARFTDEATVADTGVGPAPVLDIGAHELAVPMIETYCFGDGSGTPCPCANDAPLFSERGCLNSQGNGALLGASGVGRLSNDTVVLAGSLMPNGPCLYYQGTARTNGGLGNAFGDGLRCASGTNVRLGVRQNAGGTSQLPSGIEPRLSVRGGVTQPGSVRHYQIWYRNGAVFCTSDTFNLTNAVSVTWES